jgi:hypothetical protein
LVEYFKVCFIGIAFFYQQFAKAVFV